MAETHDVTATGGPPGLRQTTAEVDASFRANVRALRAIRSGTPASHAARQPFGRDRLTLAAALEPAASISRPISRPWAF